MSIPKKGLSKEEHEQLGQWLYHVSESSADQCNAVWRGYPKANRASKLMMRLQDTIASLRSEMEANAYDDGYGQSATELYYGLQWKKEQEAANGK